MMLSQLSQDPSAPAEVPAVAEETVHSAIADEFRVNAREASQKIDSMKHVSYRWKQPASTPLK